MNFRNLVPLLLTMVALPACGTATDDKSDSASGGSAALGGTSSGGATSGGAKASGGSASGGEKASGGTPSGGVTSASGGTVSSGGSEAGVGGENSGVGGSDACPLESVEKAPRNARSFGFSGTDTQYSELYDDPCEEAEDCIDPCVARGGTNEFCAASVCIEADPNYCLPPTKWRSLEYALSESESPYDSAVTSLSTGNGDTHDRLIVEDFGFAVPASARIEGITARVRHSSDGASDQIVRIVKAGQIGTTPREKEPLWPVEPTYETYGGEDDTWGETWTVEDINSPEFGLAIAALPAELGSRAYVDVVYLEVHYSLCVE